MAAAAVTNNPNAQGQVSAAMQGYANPHGSAERTEEPTAKPLPAPLRTGEQLTRPMGRIEAVMSSPAMAFGIAADSFEEEQHTSGKNSAGHDLNSCRCSENSVRCSVFCSSPERVQN